MGHCRYCGHRAGWFRSSHRRCAATYRQGLAQLVDLVAAASGQPDFTQRRMLRILDGLAQQRYVPIEYLPAVLAAGWHLSDLNRMVDDVLTQSETAPVAGVPRRPSPGVRDPWRPWGVDSGRGGARCPGDAPAVATARAGVQPFATLRPFP